MADIDVQTATLSTGAGQYEELAGNFSGLASTAQAAASSAAAGCEGFGPLPGALENLGAKLSEAVTSGGTAVSSFAEGLSGCASGYDSCESENMRNFNTHITYLPEP